jgi:hypothetical protein
MGLGITHTGLAFRWPRINFRSGASRVHPDLQDTPVYAEGSHRSNMLALILCAILTLPAPRASVTGALLGVREAT